MPLRRISTRSFGEPFPTPHDDTQRSCFLGLKRASLTAQPSLINARSMA
jgi:hypothetical protein